MLDEVTCTICNLLPGWPNSQDLVCPGVSNSGITRIPRILASSMIVCTFVGE